jgi:lysine 2-monooxygenase
VGAGISGLIAAFELMKLGVKPVVYEASQLGGRLRSQQFEGAPVGVVAELGGMRFPASSTAFYHYVDMLGLETRPFPNPLTAASGSMVIDIEGVTHYLERPEMLPPLFQQVADAWAEALEGVHFTEIQNAIRARDVPALKSLWNSLVPVWDDRTFYDFVASSEAFSKLSFHHREVFGQVGFGTGGWDSDFPNSMLEILRVVMTNCDEDQHLVAGGVEQVPRGLWEYAPSGLVHWPVGTTLASLHSGAPRAGWPVSRGTTTVGSSSPTPGATPAITPRCSSRARVGCSPPRSSVMRACSPRGCGRHWTALDICSRRRHLSWSTVRSGRTRTRAPAVT